jgi:hypothetical protein
MAIAYVMVPVPEELWAEARKYLAQLLSKDYVSPWKPEEMAPLLARASGEARKLLVTVADRTIESGDLDTRAVADELGVSVAEVLGLAQIAGRAPEGERRWALIMVNDEDTGNWPPAQSLTLRDDLAWAIREADREARRPPA